MEHQFIRLDADLHVFFLELSTGMVTAPLYILLEGPSFLVLLPDHHSSIAMLHLSVFYSKLIDDHSFSLIRQPVPLSVDMLVVSMANNLTAWQPQLASAQELDFFNIQSIEGFLSGLAFAFAKGCV